jgi:hypothetical protein
LQRKVTTRRNIPDQEDLYKQVKVNNPFLDPGG